MRSVPSRGSGWVDDSQLSPAKITSQGRSPQTLSGALTARQSHASHRAAEPLLRSQLRRQRRGKETPLDHNLSEARSSGDEVSTISR